MQHAWISIISKSLPFEASLQTYCWDMSSDEEGSKIGETHPDLRGMTVRCKLNNGVEPAVEIDLKEVPNCFHRRASRSKSLV